MKKVTNKLIAIVLAMTLVFSMSGVAFAGSADGAVVPEKAVTQKAGETVKAQLKAKAASKARVMTEDEMDTLSIKTMLTSTTSAPGYDEWELDPYTYGEAAVTATTTGYVWFDLSVSGSSSSGYADFILFENAYDEYGYDLGRLYAGQSSSGKIFFYLTKGETYYLYFENLSSGTVTVNARAKMYSNVNNRTLSPSSSTYMWISGIGAPVYDEDTDQVIYPYNDKYVKVKPSKTGVMTVDLKESGYSTYNGYVTLYDANKNRISDSKILYSSSKTASKAYFGVSKGKTYYIRVQSCYGTAKYGYRYGIRYNVASATDRSISSSSKAVKISKGKTYSTLFRATNTTNTDYYKFYVPAKRTTKFSVDTTKVRSGKIYVRVYKNGKQVGSTKTINPSATKTTYTVTYGTTSGKASAGTYYVKVSKSAKCSGLYKIKYVQ